jgi:hypothetical protein
MSAVSSTLYRHFRMHSSKSAISLWWMVCAFQLQGSFPNRCGQELSPTQPSLRSQLRS